MSSTPINLTPELHDYVVAKGVRETPLQIMLRRETAQMEGAIMQVSPDNGALLAFLVATIGARHCLEVGVYTGYSSLAVAMQLPDGGRITACDLSEKWTAVARRYWREAGVDEKIELHLGPAAETLADLREAGRDGTYDFAFIDADKENYDTYYEQGLHLLRKGGLMAIDNVLWSGAVIDAAKNDGDTRAIRALNDRIHGDERVQIVMLAVADGVTLVRKL